MLYKIIFFTAMGSNVSSSLPLRKRILSPICTGGTRLSGYLLKPTWSSVPNSGLIPGLKDLFYSPRALLYYLKFTFFL